MLPDWFDDAANIGQFIELGLILLGIMVLSTGRPRATLARWLAEHAPAFLRRGGPPGEPLNNVEIARIYEGTDGQISADVETLFKDELCRLEAIRHGADYDFLGTEYTFHWGEFMIEAATNLWSELANGIARELNETVEYVVFLSNPRGSAKTPYTKFYMELRKTLEGANEIEHDQLLPTHINGTMKIFGGDAVGKATLVVELVQQRDGFIQKAVDYLSTVENCDVKGVVTLFGNFALPPAKFEPIRTCTLLKLNLGVA